MVNNEWDIYRFCSVQSILEGSLSVLRLNLLRYGYLLKSLLDDEVKCAVYNVGYHLGATIDDVSVVLYFEKVLLPVDTMELVSIIEEIASSDVTVNCDDSCDVILFVNII